MTSAKVRVREALARAGAGRHHRAEVARLTAAPWDDPASMDCQRLELLRDTFTRAARSSPFYRELLAGAAPDIRTWSDLASVPVTSKADLRASGLDRARPSPLPTRVTWRTSGSSGEPYAYAVDAWYVHRHRAQRAFVYLRAGLAPGDRILEIVPGRGRVDGPERGYPTFHRSAVGYQRADIDATLRDVGPRLLYGNRSHLLEIADRVERSGAPVAIEFVCSSSETLYPRDEARLEEVFGARVLEVYGSAECANVAFRLPGATTWPILEPRVVVEVLDDRGQPVGAGELGELVVTTLTERTSPMIRYATGDLARIHAGSGTGTSGLALSSLEGRSVDSLVDHAGAPVSFWDVAMNAFWASPAVTAHVDRWQLHQRADRSVRVAIELAPGGDPAVFESLLLEHLRPSLGAVPVDVGVVDRVHDPSSGKFRGVTSDADRA